VGGADAIYTNFSVSHLYYNHTNVSDEAMVEIGFYKGDGVIDTADPRWYYASAEDGGVGYDENDKSVITVGSEHDYKVVRTAVSSTPDEYRWSFYHLDMDNSVDYVWLTDLPTGEPCAGAETNRWTEFPAPHANTQGEIDFKIKGTDDVWHAWDTDYGYYTYRNVETGLSLTWVHRYQEFDVTGE
jgi:hypothetical protein